MGTHSTTNKKPDNLISTRKSNTRYSVSLRNWTFILLSVVIATLMLKLAHYFTQPTRWAPHLHLVKFLPVYLTSIYHSTLLSSIMINPSSGQAPTANLALKTDTAWWRTSETAAATIRAASTSTTTHHQHAPTVEWEYVAGPTLRSASVGKDAVLHWEEKRDLMEKIEGCMW
jgi:hypothetical protein